MKRASILFLVLSVLTLLLSLLALLTGSSGIAPNDALQALFGLGDETNVLVMREIRLPRVLVGFAAGSALSLAGLQMQVLFRNPLAGPYVLGITSGASLGVALLMLGAPLLGLTVSGGLGIAGAAWVGAAAVLALVGAVALRIKDIMVVLILGMMFSSGVGALVQVMQYLSPEGALKSFVLWTMGSLSEVSGAQLWVLLPAVVVGLGIGVALIKTLNLLMLGEQYAVTMGVNPRRARGLIFASTTLLAGTVTAFCGPIGFIGLAVPHVARALFSTSDCRVLVPATILTGMVLMLACDLLARWGALPINAVTALAGIPIVVWIVLRNKTIVSV